MMVRWLVVAAALVGGHAAVAADLAAPDKPFGPEALRVLPNLVRHDRPLVHANPDTAASLADPPAVSARQAGARLAPLGLGEEAWRIALDGGGCGFADWPAAADWAVAEAAAAIGPLAELAQACGGTACLPDQGSRFERATAVLALPGGSEAPASVAARFVPVVRRLAACAATLPMPAPGGWATPWGRVAITSAEGTTIRPAADAVLVIDPGGDDVWDVSPPPPGGFRLLVDLAGNDVWGGDATATLAAVAIIDRAGDDRAESPAGGQGAALGGVALHVDLGGDDRYRAGDDAQASAQAGVAALIEGGGDDVYEAGARAQAFAGPSGVALLWDRSGNDQYRAAGAADPEARGGPLSWAQGTASGRREGIGGGMAVLRDDAGDDAYEAGMFAQGAGYYDGFGLLLEGAGRDRYRAARYAQGIGVHRAVGLLADGAGDDSYELSVGVGQGMGLDTALGVLEDGGGDDRYRAGALAQGASTANGIGVLWDRGGTDAFVLDGTGWGRDHLARGLPGLAFLLGTDADDRFTPPDGPRNRLAPQPDPVGLRPCPVLPPGGTLGDAAATLARSWPGGGSDAPALAAAADLTAALPARLPLLLDAVAPDDFATAITLREVARCWLASADDEARRSVTARLTDVLRERPDHLPWVVGGLLGRPELAAQSRIAAAEALAANRLCRARAMGLRLLPDDHPARRAARTDACLEARVAAGGDWR